MFTVSINKESNIITTIWVYAPVLGEAIEKSIVRNDKGTKSPIRSMTLIDKSSNPGPSTY